MIFEPNKKQNTMKKLIYTLSIVTMSMLFMGCPYKTKVNLESNPSESVNSAYLGSYEKKGSTTYRFVVSKKSSNYYKIEEIKNSDDEVRYAYEGYTTTIKGTKFLVTRETKSYSTDYSSRENADYYIYKISANSSGTIVKLYELSENIDETFETAAELKAFIGKYKDLSFFYEKSTLKYYKEDEDD